MFAASAGSQSIRLLSAEIRQSRRRNISGVALMLSACAMITASPHVEKNSMWFDTGVSHHVVSEEKWLHGACESDVPNVHLGGGEQHTVVSEVAVMLNIGVRLEKVLFVHQLVMF
jgi:hypothetical protein